MLNLTATLLQSAPVLILTDINSEAEYSLVLYYTNSTAQAETLLSQTNNKHSIYSSFFFCLLAQEARPLAAISLENYDLCMVYDFIVLMVEEKQHPKSSLLLVNT